MGLRGVTATPPFGRAMSLVTVDASGCWLSHASTNGNGYAQVSVVLPNGRRTTRYVHIVVWEHFNGPVPAGKELDHLCRVHNCCNPDDLEPVPRLINIRRGRAPRVVLSVANRCAKGHDLLKHSVKSGKFRRCDICRVEWRRDYYRRTGM